MEPTPMASEQPANAQPPSAGIRLRGWGLATVLIGLMLTVLLAALDQTVVGTALPRIIGELRGFDRYAWVVTAYLLASTTMIPIVGKLSDQFGRKWFLLTGIVIFLLGSALSGASQTMNQLILFRGFQGLGAGFILALIFTLIADIFPPAERARWQGVFGAVFALASVIGPAIGGWITDHATWRWVFYVNLPVGGLALGALFLYLPTTISVRSTRYRGWAAIRRIDIVGAVLAAGATVCLLLGLTWWGQTYPWDSGQVIGTLVAAGVLYLAFVINERFAREPILPLDLFRKQVFAVGALLALVLGVACFAVIVYLPLFIQGVLGNTATSSGAAITPLMFTIAIGSALAGLVIARVGRYQFIAVLGALVLAGGMVILWQMDTSTTLGEVTRNMVIVGPGLGMLQPVMRLAVQNVLPPERLGVGTSAVTYLTTTGATVGTAVLGTIVANTSSSELAARLPDQAQSLPQPVLSAATNQQVLVNPAAQHALIGRAVQAAAAKVPPGPQHDQVVAQLSQQLTTLFDQIFAATRQALAVGIQHAFAVSLGVCVAAILLTLLLKDVPFAQRQGAPGVPVPSGNEERAEPPANREATALPQQ